MGAFLISLISNTIAFANRRTVLLVTTRMRDLSPFPSPVQSGKSRAIDEQSDGTSTGVPNKNMHFAISAGGTQLALLLASQLFR